MADPVGTLNNAQLSARVDRLTKRMQRLERLCSSREPFRIDGDRVYGPRRVKPDWVDEGGEVHPRYEIDKDGKVIFPNLVIQENG